MLTSGEPTFVTEWKKRNVQNNGCDSDGFFRVCVCVCVGGGTEATKRTWFSLCMEVSQGHKLFWCHDNHTSVLWPTVSLRNW
jgi:hypothetical protein